jgi:hypothetical protein
MDSPPQKVFYGDLPDRPFEVFYSGKVHDISTPRRKTRVATGGPTRKRPRSDSKEKDNNFGRIPECTPMQDTLPCVMTPRLNDDDFGEETRADFGSMGCQAEPSSPNTDLTYAGFVEAVLSDECSFYQLSQRIFVANGWNPAKNETNVRSYSSHRCMN